MTEERLDDIDIKILRQLQRDAHLTVKELAARVHLSPSPTFERQKRLEREGYIERYMKAYQQFMLNTLGRMECIGSLHSVFVIGEIKNTHAVPVVMK